MFLETETAEAEWCQVSSDPITRQQVLVFMVFKLMYVCLFVCQYLFPDAAMDKPADATAAKAKQGNQEQEKEPEDYVRANRFSPQTHTQALQSAAYDKSFLLVPMQIFYFGIYTFRHRTGTALALQPKCH